MEWYIYLQPANPNLAILAFKFDWVHGKVYVSFIYCNNKIELKDGIEPKFYYIYLFNNNKLEVFQEYIEENLKKRYIKSL